MYECLTLLMLLVSCILLLSMLRPAGVAEAILELYCLAAALVVCWGFLLSAFNHLGDIACWAAISSVTALLNIAVCWKYRPESQALLQVFPRNWRPRHFFGRFSRFEKLLLVPLALTLVVTAVMNIAVTLAVAPHNWDGMTYHVARVAYFLQHNNLGFYDANYWAQVVHPKNSSILLLFTYLVSGREENFMQCVQLASYWVSLIAVYAITRKARGSLAQGLFAAMVSGLLTNWLMQATTTQNDMVITAFVGIMVYALFAFRETQQRKHVFIFSIAFGLAVGIKASALIPLLSVAMLVPYILFYRSATGWSGACRHGLWMIAGSMVALLLFALPSGYLENYRLFGHPVGPVEIREMHSFAGQSPDYIVHHGTRNVFRIGFDFMRLDGIPPILPVREFQKLLLALPQQMVAGLDLEAPGASRLPFSFNANPAAHEDEAYWGVMGVWLVWLCVGLSLLRKDVPVDIKVLSCAALLFWMAQAFAGPYDPWRGRYFITAAIFAAPALGISLGARSRMFQAYVLAIVMAGCFSALAALLLRTNSAFISIEYASAKKQSVFAMNRLQQLTSNNPARYEALARFDALVPLGATVALRLAGDAYEYPLFGENLSRTIIPLNSFYRGMQPVPAGADFLLYDDAACRDSREIFLGADWCLRSLLPE